LRPGTQTHQSVTDPTSAKTAFGPAFICVYLCSSTLRSTDTEDGSVVELNRCDLMRSGVDPTLLPVVIASYPTLSDLIRPYRFLATLPVSLTALGFPATPTQSNNRKMPAIPSLPTVRPAPIGNWQSPIGNGS
jgi:hypothetical protein